MRLSAKILENVSGVNHWNYASEANVYEGQVNEIYIQLVDISKAIHIDSVIGEIPEYPMRYIPQGSSIAVAAVFPALDDSEEFSIAATQPFADDKSIWKITIPSSQLPKSGNFQLNLTEDGVVKSVIVKSAISAELLEVGSC